MKPSLSYRFLAQFLLAAVGCCGIAVAQSKPADDKPDDRIDFGFRIGAPITRLVKNTESTVSTSQTNPPTTTFTDVNSKSARYVVGATFFYDLSDRVALGADILYRRVGYDTTIDIYEQVTDDDDGDLIQGRSESTRANYIDTPILGRYYFKPRSEGFRPYVTGGLGLRAVTGLKTTSEITDDDGVTDTDTTPIGPKNDFLQGAVIGLGFQARDDVGFKVDLEFRITRWFQQALQSGPSNSNQNQAEVMLGITF